MNESLQALSVTCNHCGAPLEIPSGTRIVTCQYCHAQLQIHQSGGVAYTEILNAINQRTQHIATDVKIINLQNQLHALDREWEAITESYAVHDDLRKTSHPTTSKSHLVATVTFMILAAGLMIAGIIWGSRSPDREGIPLIAAAALVLIVVVGSAGLYQSAKYRRAFASYAQRRSQLVNELQHLGA